MVAPEASTVSPAGPFKERIVALPKGVAKETVINNLLSEQRPDDLLTLEALLDQGIVSENEVIRHLIYPWDKHSDDRIARPLIMRYSLQPQIQFEELRDADQIAAPGVRRLSTYLEVAQRVFRQLPQYGVTSADLGMPISGQKERDKILEMIKFFHEYDLPIQPAVAGRTHPDDVTAIKELAAYAKRAWGKDIIVYAFVGSARIRMLAQGQLKWNKDSITHWIADTVTALRGAPGIGKIIVPFEDTYGTFPDDLQAFISTALVSGAHGICICDTCSRGTTPAHTRNLIRFIGHTIAPNYPAATWEMHTHNMLGHAVENAFTAFNEGLIDTVHATSGVGDLGGNMPIGEWLQTASVNQIVQLQDSDLAQLSQVEDVIFAARGINRTTNPYNGTIHSDAARYVPSGIHASAFDRLEQVGPHLRKIIEMVYFPVSPTALGLDIRLDIVTPVSGKSNVHALAKRLGVSDKLSEPVIARILDHARNKGEPITDAEFLAQL